MFDQQQTEYLQDMEKRIIAGRQAIAEESDEPGKGPEPGMSAKGVPMTWKEAKVWRAMRQAGVRKVRREEDPDTEEDMRIAFFVSPAGMGYGPPRYRPLA